MGRKQLLLRGTNLMSGSFTAPTRLDSAPRTGSLLVLSVTLLAGNDSPKLQVSISHTHSVSN
jgi:hypothetical protein